jgi:hypothetical protein
MSRSDAARTEENKPMLKWLVLPMVVLAYLAATASAGAPRDRDRDGMPDGWERNHHLDPAKPSAQRDPDRDRLRNRREWRLRTHPRRADTDRDRLRDGAEVRRFHTNPRKRDTDGDGFRDRCELRKGTNPRKRRSHPKRRCSKSRQEPPRFLGSAPPGDSLMPTAGPFPIGVWNQDPTRMRGGQVNAVNYKNVGINTFVGLWQFPGTDPAWDTRRMQALRDHGLKTIAGDDPDWIDSRPEFADTLLGYQLGDEPDMLRVNQGPGGSHWPDPWRTRGLAVRDADPGRERHGQFGKGFCMYPWVGYDSRGDEAVDFPMYVEPTTIVSSDCYGITDPYESRSWHGIYRYGVSVDNTEVWTGGRPMWSFIEASHPFRDSDGNAAANSIADRMPPSLIMPAVWMTVIHGADGIEYFCHDFSGGGLVEDGCLNDPGMPAAMQAANASVHQYGDVLRAPDLGGTTVTSTGLNPTTLTKVHNGQKYVFAIGEGNPQNPNGQAVDATITVNGAGNGTVTVLDENRTIPMTDGRFSDRFAAYQHHVYRIGP